MARPREFDRDQALLNAIPLFWAKGYAATSTEDLVQAMGIGRQSLYNAFGDKRQLYLEALASYLRTTCDGHLKRLNTPASSLEGIGNMLAGLSSPEDSLHPSGCMAIGSVGEFGTTDAKIGEMMAKVASLITERVAQRIREGQAAGEIDPVIDADEAAGFVRVVVNGLQVAARGGAAAADLDAMARFAVKCLRTMAE